MSEPRHLPVYIAPDLCGPCAARGTSCCGEAPGTPSPDEFGAPDPEVMVERIVMALRTGRWSLDWWEAERHRGHDEEALRHDVFFPRPAIRGDEGELFYPSQVGGNPCTFLGATGCELEHDGRPLECRALEPRPPGEACGEHAGSRRERALEWWPYRDVIARVREALAAQG